ncbi:MAG: YggS family pyridoxal phosphate-dependent enzyme [Betaproteobacteria bacterium]|nr:YggS family pyridoxal phosphate-dependent enzyme [Betaproteobacteria bacterium]
MNTQQNRLQGVKSRIALAAAAAGRDPRDILLLAVSKTFPAERIRTTFADGQTHFGENYLQEAMEKMDGLADLPITWHFIGPIQSNKTRLIAERFGWVHSIERSKIAERLAAQRPLRLPPLQVCIQVNTSGEVSKSGCAPEEVMTLARAVAKMSNLQLRGLMTVPEPTNDLRLQRSRFESLAVLLQQCVTAGVPMDTLSMGMSMDLEQAIAAGATIVRIGTAIFGERAVT